MNNKGFTLIELLAVVVILAGISLIAVVSITSSLERRGNKECEEQISLAKNAAKIYFSLNNVSSITIGELKTDHYFDNNTAGSQNADSKVDKLLNSDIVRIAADRYEFLGTGECKEDS